MADSTLIQTILSGVISGGTSATTAFLAVFRSIKQRLTTLEEQVGKDGKEGDPKTGLHLVIERLEERTKKIQKELETWEDDPPEWLLRLVNRAARGSSVNMEHHHEIERLIESRYKTNRDNITRLQEQLDALEKALNDYVSKADFERDGRQRAEELGRIREQLATSNGLLRGVMSALGYIDPESKKRGG